MSKSRLRYNNNNNNKIVRHTIIHYVHWNEKTNYSNL